MIYTVGNTTHIRITFIDALLLSLIGNDRRIGHEIHIRENYSDHRVHLGIHVLNTRSQSKKDQRSARPSQAAVVEHPSRNISFNLSNDYSVLRAKSATYRDWTRVRSRIDYQDQILRSKTLLGQFIQGVSDLIWSECGLCPLREDAEGHQDRNNSVAYIHADDTLKEKERHSAS
jgi:hypothetical protein